MKTKKGFTLIEMIIVLAIIGIFAAMLMPSWGNMIASARWRSANNKAKAIFNAAQTVATDFKFRERSQGENYMTSTGDFYFYWDGSTGYKCDSSGNPDGSGSDVDFGNEKMGSSIKKIVDDGMVYKIYIKNYQVKSVTCGRFESDGYIGAYPVTVEKFLETSEHTLGEIRGAHVKGADMKNFVTPPPADEETE